MELGWAFIWGAMALGYGGMSWSLLSAYRRGEDRGDWCVPESFTTADRVKAFNCLHDALK